MALCRSEALPHLHLNGVEVLLTFYVIETVRAFAKREQDHDAVCEKREVVVSVLIRRVLPTKESLTVLGCR